MALSEKIITRVSEQNQSRPEYFDMSDLDINDTNIIELIPLLQNVPKLDISLNDLGVGGAIIIAKSLPNLKYLSIWHNKIGDSGAIAIAENLIHLEGLDIWHCGITEIGIKAVVENLHNLTLLETGSNNLGDPGAILIANNGKKLKSLNMYLANITSIGASAIAQNLKQLTHLNLSSNNIANEGVIAIAETLRSLTFLNVTSNNIDHAGAKVIAQNLKQLNSLHIGINNIGQTGATQIAEGLKKLAFLNITSNAITDEGLLAITQKLSHLTFLNVSKNNITDSGAIAIANNLKPLTSLNISENKLSDHGIQILIANLSSLSNFTGEVNETVTIPTEFLNNITSLRGYFSDTTNLIHSPVVKMILLGNTGAGKTSLAYKLSTGKIPKHESTHGMQLWKWALHKKKIEVNIFDFGGQDYYHATHNLFLNDNSLFVIVWHQTNNQNKIDVEQDFSKTYWLGNIDYIIQTSIPLGYEKKKADGFGIWLIQNKADIDGATMELLSHETANLYACDAEGIFYQSIENKGKSSIWNNSWRFFKYKLEEKIIELTGKIKITKTTLEIRNWLPEITSFFVISRRDFDNLAKEKFKIYNDDVLYNALDYLSKCGELIWFKDDPKLADYIFTDPIAFSQKIYEILAANVKNVNAGEFDKKHVRNVLKGLSKLKAPFLEDLFMAILESNELIFQKPGSDIFIAPQYLPLNNQEIYLRDILPVSLVLKFQHYIPFGRMTTFITRYIKNKPDAIIWKFGAMFEEGDYNIMVRMNVHEQKVYFHIQQKNEFNSTSGKKKRADLLRDYFSFFAIMNFDSFRKGLNKDKKDVNLVSVDSHFFKKMSISVDDTDFFNISELYDSLNQSQSRVKSINGNYRIIPAIFYNLLDSKKILPKKIFFSYSHKDAQYRHELEAHFAALKRSGLVETWYDLEIHAGDEWDTKILNELKNADIILMLLSADFMNSSYIWEKEIPAAIENKKIVVPIFLRPCDFDIGGYTYLDNISEFNITSIQGAPLDNGNGIPWIIGSHWQYRDEAYLKVVERIKDILKKE
jgi:internalin A